MANMASYITGMRARGIQVSDISDTDLTAIITEALYPYSNYFYLTDTLIFDTVADQQKYTWTEMGDALGVCPLALVWNPVSPLDNEFNRILINNGVIDLLPDWNMPSLDVVAQIKMSSWAQRFGGKWYQLDSSGGDVYLTPTPEESGIKVWMFYGKMHADVSTIADNDRDAFLTLVESMCASWMVKSLASKAMGMDVKTPEYEIRTTEAIRYWRNNAKESMASFVAQAQSTKAVCART